MIGFIIRSVWRLLVLLLGIGLAYAVVFILFPYLDQKLPLFAVLLVLYIGVAYFGLPALLRTWRLVIRPDHIPLYVTSPDGWPVDPVNIAMVARSKRQFVAAMERAGWHVADKATLVNNTRALWAMVLNKPYPAAPFSPLFLFNRIFDIGFQIPYGKSGSPRYRHHVRFWQLIDRRDDHGHFRFWIKHFRRFIGREHMVWIGAATDDINIYGIRWRDLQLTHRQREEHYRERDFIIESLGRQGLVKQTSEVKAGDPFSFQGQSMGTTFVSDGRLTVVELKEPKLHRTKIK